MLKITNKKYEQLSKDIANCFKYDGKPYDFEDVTVDCLELSATLEITVSKMYSYLPINFSILKRISEVLGTENFTVNQEFYDGCETCDYGSKYSHIIYVNKNELKQV